MIGRGCAAYLSIMVVRALVLWIAAGFRKEGELRPVPF